MLSHVRCERFLVITLPAVDNKHSGAAEVAGIASTRLANKPNQGKGCTAPQRHSSESRGFLSLGKGLPCLDLPVSDLCAWKVERILSSSGGGHDQEIIDIFDWVVDVSWGWVLLYAHFWSLWTLIFRLGIFAHLNSFCGFLVHLPSKTRFSGTLSHVGNPCTKVGFFGFSPWKSIKLHTALPSLSGMLSSLSSTGLLVSVILLHCMFLPVSVPVVASVVASPSRQAHVGCPLHSNCNSHACQPVWCLLV